MFISELDVTALDFTTFGFTPASWACSIPSAVMPDWHGLEQT